MVQGNLGQVSCDTHTEGRGKLLDANTIEVELASGGKCTIRTKYILIATGGKPVKAPIPGSVTIPHKALEPICT